MEDGRNQKAVKVPSDVSRPTVVGGYDAGGGQISNQHGALSQLDITALTCSKCTFLLRNPKQVIKCGHRYCQQCIEQFTSGGYVFHPPSLLASISHKLLENKLNCILEAYRVIVPLTSSAPCCLLRLRVIQFLSHSPAEIVNLLCTEIDTETSRVMSHYTLH